MVLKSLETLDLRVQRSCENALKVASFLGARVPRLLYPGLASHPQHDLAKKQMKGFGGMISVEMGSKETAGKMLERVRVFSLAESLGGVESLISHPASMTHGSVPADVKQAMGLSEGLVRLSCGVEDGDDLVADLEQAFQGL